LRNTNGGDDVTNKEAIDALRNAAWIGTDADRERIEEAIHMGINALQAQEVSNDSPELDSEFGELISRQAAIDALMEFDKKLRKINWHQYPYTEHECRGVYEAIVKIMNIPSAQPNLSNCNNCDVNDDLSIQPCVDTISRQAAINAVEFGITYAKAIDVNTGESNELFKEGNDALKKASERIKDLPSAQAEPCNDADKLKRCKFEYINACKIVACTTPDTNKSDIYDAYAVIKALHSIFGDEEF
jgi:hypothetical protein